MAWILGILGSLLLLLFLIPFIYGLVQGIRGVPAPALAGDPAGPELVLPADTQDVGFLKGCWRSGGGDLTNSDTGLPVIFVHCFDDAGNAKIIVDEKTADGEYLDTCESTATASFEGDTLRIISDPEGIPCKGDPESGYAAVNVVCRPGESGKAACVILGRNNTEATTSLTRLDRDYRPGEAM